MEFVEAHWRQAEILVESIASTFREERKKLEDERLQFEKGHPSLYHVGTGIISPQGKAAGG